MRNQFNERYNREISGEKIILYCILGILAIGILLHGINLLIERRNEAMAIEETKIAINKMNNENNKYNQAIINSSQQLMKTMPQQNYPINNQPTNTIKYRGYIEKDGVRTYY